MEITPAEVEAVLLSAGNLNAALKSLLKREGRRGNTIEPFAKALRNIVARNQPNELRKYIEANYTSKPSHFLLLAAYAFPTVCNSTAEKVVTTYADAFNATYQRGESGITIIDSEKFKSIVAATIEITKADLSDARIPCNNFSIHMVLSTIFDSDVFAEVVERLD